ncbi:unnamed protein product [Moneuplotes crassus]|uniref:Hexose transporter 1 n=1 Tax=Euplotes crassus TaxID=5936 RepID=A0AAD1UEG8_EUPCR|nr:unnamed protein product [Moneuplotes crassus]
MEASLISHERGVDKLYFCTLVFVSAIGGFLFGYDTSVIAGANLYFDNEFPDISNFQKELIVSMALVGAAIGSIFGGPIADKYGRKPTIIIADIMFTVGCLLMAFTPNIFWLIFGRFVVGIGIGVAAMVVPVYLAEISPKHIRGVIVNFNVIMITSAQFISLVICLCLGDKWRWMLGLAAVPSALQLAGMLCMHETPKWLYKTHQEEKANKVLCSIYNAPASSLSDIVDEQKTEALRVDGETDQGYFDNLCSLIYEYRPCIIAGCGLQMIQQLCGINTAMYYGPEIMQVAGFGNSNNKSQSLISTLPLAGMNALGSFIALMFIDRFGRRWIMLRSLPLIGFFMGVIGLGMGLRNHTDPDQTGLQEVGKWCAAGGLFFYLAAFSIGMGPTPWTVNSEVYPLHLRGMGNSMATTTNWAVNFLVSISFLSLIKDVPFGDIIAFLLIFVFSLLGVVFVYFKIPETKGLSLNDVLSLFVGKK